jgi:hypothetical protein
MPGLTPSSMSARFIQLCKVASAMPKSFAIWLSGVSPRRETVTTSLRNSAGYP